MADASIFIAIARIVAVCDIRKPKDENGNIIEPQVEYSSGLLRLVPFLCRIVFVLLAAH